MKLGELKIGDKFRFPKGHPHHHYGRPYLIIDFNFNSISYDTDFSNLVASLDLTEYKILGFNKEFEVEQDTDNMPV